VVEVAGRYLERQVPLGETDPNTLKKETFRTPYTDVIFRMDESLQF